MDKKPEKVTYNLIPTMTEFHECGSQIRAIIGPVGCLDASTEYLTPHGWKRFDEYTKGDLVGQWAGDGRLSWVFPDLYIKEPCEQFLVFENKHSMSMVVSQEHRMVFYDNSRNLIVRLAEEVYNHPGRREIPINFTVCRRDYAISDASLRVMIMFCADGSIHKNGTKQKIVLRKKRKKERLGVLLRAAGIAFTVHPAKNRPTEVGYGFVPPIKTKKLTHFGWRLSQRQLEIVVEEMSYWDGLYEGNDMRFSTAHKDEADFMQYAVHATGGRATISKEVYEKKNWNPSYIVHIAKKGSIKSKVIMRSDSCDISIKPSEDGYKYCFSVPTGMLVLRRKGRIFISGNSGKTSAASMEIGFYKPLFLFHRYGIKRTRWAVIRNCFDDQTEILTELRGWVLFKDLEENDKVASNVDGRIEYVKPTYYYQAPYKGEMIGIKSQNMDLLVTPNHKLWISKRKTRKKVWGEYKAIKAEDIYGINQLYRMSSVGEWHGGGTVYSENFFEFLGFWFAEGYAGVYDRKDCKGKHYRLVVTQNDRDGYVEDLLKRNKFKYGKCAKKGGKCFNYSIKLNARVKIFIRSLAILGKAKTKYIPRWIKEADARHLRAFIKGYQRGDGSYKNENPKKCDILYTASKQLADDLQEIIFKTGKCSAINKRQNNGFGGKGSPSTSYTVTIRTELRSYPMILKEHWSKQEYDGTVYCVEVPSHVVYVRRNDVSVWSMQTYGELIDTTLKTVREWFPGAEYFVKSKDGNNIMFIRHPKFDVTVELLFRSCDNPDDVKKFKSLEITGYWIDESIEVDETIKKMLKTRIGRFPKKCPVRFGIETTNPPDVEHPTYSQFKWNVPPPGPKPKGEPLENHAGFWQPPYENEENLRDGYYEDLKNDYKDDPDWAQMYIEGKPGIIIKGKIIYNNFRRDMHESRTPLEWKGGKIIRGWDNSGNIPAAIILDMPTDTSVQALLEFTTERENIAAFTRRVVTVCNQLYPGAKFLDFGDPAGDNEYSKGSGGFTSNSKIMYEECGVDVYPSEQNLTMRISAVEQLLSRIDGLIIDPNLIRLLNGFLGGYCYPKIGSTEWYSDKPSKNRFSHIHDALQYAIVRIFQSINTNVNDYEDEDDYQHKELGRSSVTGY